VEEKRCAYAVCRLGQGSKMVQIIKLWELLHPMVCLMLGI
jgi:hypothetical protein